MYRALMSGMAINLIVLKAKKYQLQRNKNRLKDSKFYQNDKFDFLVQTSCHKIKFSEL